MFINVIKGHRHVVALADKELVGKVFSEGNFQLDVKKSFYRGDEKNSEEVAVILKNMKIEDATFNIVGNKSVNLAKDNEIISEENIGEIDGVKFALILI